jgi:hypothetical protein
VGLLARDHLMVLLRRVMARGLPAPGGAGGAGGAAADDVSFEDLSRNFVSAAARSLILEQQLAVLQARRALARQAAVAGDVVGWIITSIPLMDGSMAV